MVTDGHHRWSVPTPDLDWASPNRRGAIRLRRPTSTARAQTGRIQWTPLKASVKSAVGIDVFRRSRRSCWNRAGPVGAGREEPIKIGKRLPILVAVAVLLAGVR